MAITPRPKARKRRSACNLLRLMAAELREAREFSALMRKRLTSEQLASLLEEWEAVTRYRGRPSSY